MRRRCQRVFAKSAVHAAQADAGFATLKYAQAISSIRRVRASLPSSESSLFPFSSSVELPSLKRLSDPCVVFLHNTCELDIASENFSFRHIPYRHFVD
jgi:hypothetical protein